MKEMKTLKFPNQEEAYEIVDAYAREQAAVGARIQTGSYTGTGTYGASNPCSLTFNFVPKLVAIIGYTGTTGEWGVNRQGDFVPYELLTTSYQEGIALTGASASTTALGKCSEDRKTFYWYQKENANASLQYNYSGIKYFWVAIG